MADDNQKSGGTAVDGVESQSQGSTAQRRQNDINNKSVSTFQIPGRFTIANQPVIVNSLDMERKFFDFRGQLFIPIKNGYELKFNGYGLKRYKYISFLSGPGGQPFEIIPKRSDSSNAQLIFKVPDFKYQGRLWLKLICDKKNPSLFDRIITPYCFYSFETEEQKKTRTKTPEQLEAERIVQASKTLVNPAGAAAQAAAGQVQQVKPAGEKAPLSPAEKANQADQNDADTDEFPFGEGPEAEIAEQAEIMAQTVPPDELKNLAQPLKQYLGAHPEIVADENQKNEIIQALNSGDLSNLSSSSQALLKPDGALYRQISGLALAGAGQLQALGLTSESSVQLRRAMEIVKNQTVAIGAGGQASQTAQTRVQGQATVSGAAPAGGQAAGQKISGSIKVAGSTPSGAALPPSAGNLSLKQSREIAGEYLSKNPAAMPATQDRQAALEFLASGDINKMNAGQRAALQSAISASTSSGAGDPRQQAALRNVNDVLSRVSAQIESVLKQNGGQVGEFLDKSPSAMPLTQDRQAVLRALAGENPAGNLGSLTPRQKAGFRKFLDAQIAGPAKDNPSVLQAMQNLKLVLDGSLPEVEISEQGGQPVSPPQPEAGPQPVQPAAAPAPAGQPAPESPVSTKGQQEGQEILERLKKGERPLSDVVPPEQAGGEQEGIEPRPPLGPAVDRAGFGEGLDSKAADEGGGQGLPERPKTGGETPGKSAAPTGEQAPPVGGVEPPEKPSDLPISPQVLAQPPAGAPKTAPPVEVPAAVPPETAAAGPAGLAAVAAAEALSKPEVQEAVGQATSKVWYYGFASSALTFFTGLDFMLGAMVMAGYWIFGHRKNKDLFPLKRWQKAITIFAVIVPPLLVTGLIVLIIYVGCSTPLVGKVTDFTLSKLGYVKVCQTLNDINQTQLKRLRPTAETATDIINNSNQTPNSSQPRGAPPDNNPPTSPSGGILSFIKLWNGADPYPAVDWGDADPNIDPTIKQNLIELKGDFNSLNQNWQSAGRAALRPKQVYRPEAYQDHYRTVWEIYAIINNKDNTVGYQCDQITHLDPTAVKQAYDQAGASDKQTLQQEFRAHGVTGPTPAGCVSDHASGIAMDIEDQNTAVFKAALYSTLISTAQNYGLCHDIAGDQPHFALKNKLPAGTNCSQP